MAEQAAGVHSGSCLCGHVAFEAAGEPIHISNCHCRMCQKATGAAFATFAEFLATDIAWTGERPTWRASSEMAERGFCPECGSAVAFHYKEAETVDLAVALFDDPNAFAPREDIWTESAEAWTAFDSRIPQHTRSRTP